MKKIFLNKKKKKDFCEVENPFIPAEQAFRGNRRLPQERGLWKMPL